MTRLGLNPKANLVPSPRNSDIESAIRRALEEDIGDGDATTLCTIPASASLLEGLVWGERSARRILDDLAQQPSPCSEDIPP